MKIALPEVLTLAHARGVMGTLRAALRDAPGPMVRIDASMLGQLDTSAIAVLLQCRREVQARGLILCVDGMPPKLAALLTLYGVMDLFGPAGRGLPTA